MVQRQFTNLNLAIPDNDPSGLAQVQTISGSPPGSVVVDVNVRLKIDGPAPRNGDLYVALDHLSGYTVLLNRVGRGPQSPFGYEDAGFDLTFDDEAENGDVHLYRARLFGNHETPVGQGLSSSWSGRWRPDGRNVDPDLSTIESPRRASLSSLKGLPVDGRWRLFLADVAPGGLSQLQEWSLEILATTNLNALSLELTDATIRADQSREVTIPLQIQGGLSISGGAGTTLAGTVAGDGQLIKSGGGTLTLSGANTFSGGIALEDGALVLDNDLAAGLGPIRLRGGSLKASGGPRRLDNAVSLGGALAFASGDRLELAGAVRLDGTTSLAVENETEISGDIQETEPGAAFVKRGSGKLTLSGANTFSGGIALEDGALAIGNDRALGTGPLKVKANAALSASGGPRTVANPAELAGKLNFVGADLLSFTGPIQLNADATFSVESEARLAGPLQEDAPGLGFVKQGNGTLVLEGANTFSGGVNIEEGKLLVNNLTGSATGSGEVRLSGRSILGGTGKIAGPVTLGSGAALAPGASPGALTTGSQNWDSGARLVWEINDADGTQVNNPGWDLLRIDGRLELATGGRFVLEIVSLGLDNQPGAAANFDSSKDYVWKVAETAAGVGNFQAAAFEINFARFANRLNGGKLSLEVRGNDLLLTFSGARPPRVDSVQLAAGNLLRFTIRGTANQSFQVQMNDTLDSSRWVLLREIQLSASGETELEIAVAPDQPVRFFRVADIQENAP